MNNSYTSQIHHRRSIRLRGYDYSQAGFYFVTICAQNHLHLFGEIPYTLEMILNDVGTMVFKMWHEIPADFHNVRLHEFVIMPNHIHGIIEIIPVVGADSISAPRDSISAPRDSISAPRDSISANGAEIDSAPTDAPSLSDMIQSFKRHTTIEYIKMVKQNILPPFNKRIWQRNYWEHIIRNENEYLSIVEYIQNNPAKWAWDKLNVGIGNQVMESQALYNDEVWMV